MPTTLARDQFDKWTQHKAQDAQLTTHQQDTVLHFVDVLYSELCMELIHRTYSDKTELSRLLVQAYPQHEAEILTVLPPIFAQYEIAEHSNLLTTTMALIGTITRQQRKATSWLGVLSEANQQLMEMILIDSPDVDGPQEDWIPLDAPSPTLTMSTTTGYSTFNTTGSRRRGLPTPADIARDPFFHCYLEASKAMRTHATNTVMDGRSTGSIDKHPLTAT